MPYFAVGLGGDGEFHRGAEGIVPAPLKVPRNMDISLLRTINILTFEQGSAFVTRAASLSNLRLLKDKEIVTTQLKGLRLDERHPAAQNQRRDARLKALSSE
jgi:hypothetical protein